MADGAVNIDLILNDQTDKTWSEFKSKAEQQGKEGHETFKKSFGDEPLIAKLEAKANKEGITDFKSLLNELPKEKQTELLAKAEKGEAIDFEKYIQNMPKKKVVSLETQAKNAGIDNFDKLLKKLPKKTVTDLQTRAEKGEVINFEQLLHKIPSKYITQLQLNDNASPELRKLQSEAEETKHKFSNLKDVMLGTFAGNAVFKGVTALTGGFESIISDLDESSKAWQTFAGNMHEFGKSGAEIGKVKSELQDFAQKSIYSASDMASTYSQLAAVGTKNTTELVKGFGGLAAASEDPKQAMKTLSQQATQMASKPKVAWEDFKLVLEQSPAGMSAVAKSMGMSVGELTQKVQNGQVATQDLFDAITKAGTSDNFTKMATNYKTVGQAVDGLREGLTNKLQSAFDSSSKVGIKMVSNISKSIDNFDTKPMMNKLSSLISYITSHSKDISGIFGSVKDIATDLIGGAWDAAKSTLTTIADMFGLINKNSKKAHDPLKAVNHVLKTIADHKEAIKALGAALVAAFAVKKISDFVGGLMLVTKNLKLAAAAQAIFNAVAKANWISILVVALVGLAVGLVELYKHSKKFRDFVNGLVDAAVDFAKGVGKWFGNAFDAIGDFFKDVGKSFNNGGKNIQKFVKNIGKWFKGIGKSIGNGANAIGDWFSGLVKGFQKGWDKFIKAVKKIAIGFGKVMLYALALPIGIDIAITKPLVKPLKNIFNSLVKDVKKIWNGLTDFLGKVFDREVKGMKVVWNGLTSFLEKIWRPVQKTWTKVWNAISDFFDELWNGKHGIKRLFSDAINAISDVLGDVLKDISKTWSKTWNKISDFFDDIWNGKHGIKRLFSDAINAISDVLDKVLGGISKTWNKVWGAIADFFDDIWNGKHGIRNTASKAWSWFSDGLSNFGDGISKTWNNMWTGIRDFFSDIWKDIKGLAKDGMNGIIGFINTGVGGINGVIHDFGGKKQTIAPLKKLATGTSGAPRGLAMVNDGFDSPTGQELIIDNKGNGTILSGRNRLVNFEGGETVVPAGVTHAMLAGHMFANGTNDWFGDVKHFFGDVAGDIGDAISSATGKAKDFLGIAMHPVKYIEDKIFSPMTKGIGNLAGSAISSLGSAVGGNNGVKGQQNNWWHELWNMLKDTMSGSGGGGLGDDYRFKNKSKDEGAPSGDPWGYFFRECVSFVASRLANVGVKPSLFTGLGNGSNWTSAHVKHKSTPSVGDIAVYSNGSKYGNHVSVVTGVNNGRYSEEGYNYAGNGKYYKSSGLKFGDATTFLNFGRSAARSKSDSNKSDSPLQKLIRSQVGGMFDWVSDMMSNLLGSFNGGGDQAGSSAAPSGSHKHWLRQAGIHGDFDKWNYIINHESGWNPKAKNPGSSAYGIGQALPPSKMASFGSDYMSNPITQLKWMKSYVNDRYGGIDHAYNFWRSHHWYANGGRTNGVGLVGEVDGEDEWVINPNRHSADETILGSIKETADKQPNSFAAKLSQVINTAKTGSQSNMITQLPHGSHIQNGGQANGNIDLSGDVHMVVQLDSGEVARATYPKIKMLQNQDIQLKGQITGNTYVY
jgi:tape measure domain-containing protein